MTDDMKHMIDAGQIPARDAEAFLKGRNGADEAPSEEEVLKWVAREYGVSYTELVDIKPDRELLSLFPARMLLKHILRCCYFIR